MPSPTTCSDANDENIPLPAASETNDKNKRPSAMHCDGAEEHRCLLGTIDHLFLDFYRYCLGEVSDRGLPLEERLPDFTPAVRHFQNRLRNLVGYEKSGPVLNTVGKQLFGHRPSTDLAEVGPFYQQLLDLEQADWDTRSEFVQGLEEMLNNEPQRAEALASYRDFVTAAADDKSQDFGDWIRVMDIELLDYFLRGNVKHAQTEEIRQRMITTMLVINMDGIASVCSVRTVSTELSGRGLYIFGHATRAELRYAERMYERLELILLGHDVIQDRAWYLDDYCTEPDFDDYYEIGLRDFRAGLVPLSAEELHRVANSPAASDSGMHEDDDFDRTAETDPNLSDNPPDQPQGERGGRGALADITPHYPDGISPDISQEVQDGSPHDDSTPELTPDNTGYTDISEVGTPLRSFPAGRIRMAGDLNRRLTRD